MERVDHRQTLKHLYNSSRRTPVLVDVPPLNFLMIDGSGKPTGAEFQQAAETLYPVAYVLKFSIRSRYSIDYHVMPMEVCWDVNRQQRRFAWTMMIMQPEVVTPELVAEAVENVKSKGEPPLLSRLRFEPLAEGPCVQFLHTGPYEGMDGAMNRMIAFAGSCGYGVPYTNAHDIYLNDVRKTKPENLKAVMRLKIRRLGL